MSEENEIDQVIEGPSAEEELALVKESPRNHALDLVLFILAGSIGFVVVSLLTRYLAGLLGGSNRVVASLVKEIVAS